MLGSGGDERSGPWGLLAAGGLLGLSGLAGCGGRTSVLDLAAYTEGGGSSFGGTSGQAGSSGRGGSSNKPDDPGKAGGRNADDAARCKDYCDAYLGVCADDFDQASCAQACQAEIGSAKCREITLKLLVCLTPLLRPPGSCEEVAARALAVCESQLQQLELCRGPRPEPEPEPEPPPGCSSSVSVGDDTCEGEWICNDFSYAVSCRNVQGSANCLCIQNGEVAREVGAGGWQSSSCYAGARACGFPAGGPDF